MSRPLHTIVGCVAEFPISDGPTPGEELAHFLHARLTQAGLSPSEPFEQEGWAWEMFTVEGEVAVRTLVGFVGDMESQPPRQWLVTNTCEVPFLKRWFGRADFERKREALLRRLCDSLHATLRADSRFSQVHWYDERTFDGAGDVPSDAP
jgi:hypothetical protein